MISKGMSWCQQVCHDNKVCYIVKNSSRRHKICHSVKMYVIEGNVCHKKYVKSTSWRHKIQKVLMVSKIDHNIKKYGKYVMTSQNTQWRQQLLVVAKIPELWTIVYFSRWPFLRWPWPLTYFRELRAVIFIDNADIIPGYHNTKFCNNFTTCNNYLWTHIKHTHRHTHTDTHTHSEHTQHQR